MTTITSIALERRFDPGLRLVVQIEGDSAEYWVREPDGRCSPATRFPSTGQTCSHALVVAAVRNQAFAALDRMLDVLCQCIQIERGWCTAASDTLKQILPGGSGSGCPAVVSGGNSVMLPVPTEGQAATENSTGGMQP